MLERMNSTIEAIYKNGVLEPLQPLMLNENERVRITIAPSNGWLDELLDHAFMTAAAAEADDSITLEQVRTAASGIPGSLVDDFVAEREDR